MVILKEVQVRVAIQVLQVQFNGLLLLRVASYVVIMSTMGGISHNIDRDMFHQLLREITCLNNIFLRVRSFWYNSHRNDFSTPLICLGSVGLLFYILLSFSYLTSSDNIILGFFLCHFIFLTSRGLLRCRSGVQILCCNSFMLDLILFFQDEMVFILIWV